MKKASILVIEDEDQIAKILQLELTHEGYEAQVASTGREGLDLFLSGRWDLVLLDIMLPELNGLEVLRRIRQANRFIPVILLTARDATPDKVSGLDSGANDYITKPFEIEEVLARIRVCLRAKQRNSGIPVQEEPGPTVLNVADLRVDLLSRQVLRGGKLIDLTPKEFDLLVHLMEHRNEVLSRETIINQVWGFDFVGDTNVVDVYIRYLRKKIDYPFKVPLIHTYRGVGYSIKEST
ncbi:response regulator transcription factor [Paenibacillus sp. y28]|uniref:response regulator transcription factor n=1 Tax=Paenibacillus sp. y28 TaxID=3129110 RepID=UPI003018D494